MVQSKSNEEYLAEAKTIAFVLGYRQFIRDHMVMEDCANRIRLAEHNFDPAKGTLSCLKFDYVQFCLSRELRQWQRNRRGREKDQIDSYAESPADVVTYKEIFEFVLAHCTTHQLKIFTRLMEGCTQRELAKELNVVPHSIWHSIDSVRRKLQRRFPQLCQNLLGT